MSELINAKGLGCTQPVVLARNALELYDDITIVVDEQRALENLEFLGMHVGYSGMHVGYLVDVSGESKDIYWVRLRRASSNGRRLTMGKGGSSR